jgi:hypothetical protein
MWQWAEMVRLRARPVAAAPHASVDKGARLPCTQIDAPAKGESFRMRGREAGASRRRWQTRCSGPARDFDR